MRIESITFIRKDGETAKIDSEGGLPYLEDKDLMGFLEKQGIIGIGDMGISIGGDGHVVVDYRKKNEEA
jgi:hypothetical protein